MLTDSTIGIRGKFRTRCVDSSDSYQSENLGPGTKVECDSSAEKLFVFPR